MSENVKELSDHWSDHVRPHVQRLATLAIAFTNSGHAQTNLWPDDDVGQAATYGLSATLYDAVSALQDFQSAMERA